MLLANFGVIAGVIFLALEISQNNELMQAEASFRLKDNRAMGSQLVLESPEYVALTLKISNGEVFTDLDEVRLKAYVDQMLINWQWEYGEFKAGRMSSNIFPANQYAMALKAFPFALEGWESFKLGIEYDKDFIKFMEDEVIAKLK